MRALPAVPIGFASRFPNPLQRHRNQPGSDCRKQDLCIELIWYRREHSATIAVDPRRGRALECDRSLARHPGTYTERFGLLRDLCVLIRRSVRSGIFGKSGKLDLMAARLPIFPATFLSVAAIGIAAGAIALEYPRDPRQQPARQYPRDYRESTPPVPQPVARVAYTEQSQAITAPLPEQPPVAMATNTRAATSADLVAACTRMLENLVSIEAKVRQEAHIFDRHLVGSGTYQQGWDGSRLWRLELLMRDGEDQLLFQQVCNGRTLRIHQRAGDLQELRIVELARANQTLDAVSKKKGAPPITWGTGGLPQIIESIAEAFELSSPVADRSSGELCWKLSGRWRREYLAALLPEQREKILKGASPDLRKMPEHLPETVDLYLRGNDYFPVRIEYQRTPRLSFYEKLYRSADPETLVVMEFFHIRVGMPIDPNRFNLGAGNIDVIDHTPEQISDVQSLNEAVIESRQ